MDNIFSQITGHHSFNNAISLKPVETNRGHKEEVTRKIITKEMIFVSCLYITCEKEQPAWYFKTGCFSAFSGEKKKSNFRIALNYFINYFPFYSQGSKNWDVND